MSGTSVVVRTWGAPGVKWAGSAALLNTLRTAPQRRPAPISAVVGNREALP